jgi:hypothetical protein
MGAEEVATQRPMASDKSTIHRPGKCKGMPFPVHPQILPDYC